LGMFVDTSVGYIRAFQYTPLYGGAWTQFTPDEIAYSRLDNPFDDLRGLSPMETVLLEVGIDRNISRMTKSFYANNARLGLLLIPEGDLQPSDKQRIQDFFKDNAQGARNAGKPMILPK